jgi:hypothetical protein
MFQINLMNQNDEREFSKKEKELEEKRRRKERPSR